MATTIANTPIICTTDVSKIINTFHQLQDALGHSKPKTFQRFKIVQLIGMVKEDPENSAKGF